MKHLIFSHINTHCTRTMDRQTELLILCRTTPDNFVSDCTEFCYYFQVDR